MRSGLLRQVWRGLRGGGGVPGLVIATLGLGIGAATAVFAVADAVLLNPLPYRNGGRLLELYVVDTKRPSFNAGPDAVQDAAIRVRRETFAAVEAYRLGAETLTDGDPRLVAAPGLSPGLLHALGARPIAGRLFTDEEGDREAPVVLIAERLWRTAYGGSPDAVGRRIGIEGVPHEIVGVLPAWFAYPERTAEVWHPIPARPRPAAPQRRARTVAVLAPGATPAMAEAALEAVTASLRRAGAIPADERLAAVAPVQQRFGERYRTELWLLLGAALLVLLIACTNAAHLLLARASARAGEFAVMSALGASSGRTVAALVAEAAVLAAGGALAGAVVARALLGTVLAATPEALQLFSAAVIGIDPRALAFAAALAAATCLVMALLPALRIGRADLVDALKDRGRALAGGAHDAWHRRLVVAQLALVIVLLSVSGLLLRSFARMVAVDPGFRAAGLVVAEIQFPDERYRVAGGATQLLGALEARLEAAPGIEAVTVSRGALPGGGDISFRLRPEVDGRPVEAVTIQELPNFTVAPDFFATLDIPLVAGRSFLPSDGTDAVIVNTVMARRFWGDASPVGRRLRLWADRPWHTVVGVAGDVKAHGPRDPMGEGMEAYVPYPAALRAGFHALTIRTSADPGSVAAHVRRELRALDPLLPALAIETMEARMAESVLRPRFLLRVAGLFAVVAALLAAVGVYGTTSYWVSQSQRELGVRLALGASPRGVQTLVLGRGLRLAAWSCALGLAGTLALGRVVESLLFETAPRDPVVLSATAGVLGLLVLAACFLPARRASRLDPAAVLRSE
jgi:putative ABC transport system permease protein